MAFSDEQIACLISKVNDIHSDVILTKADIEIIKDRGCKEGMTELVRMKKDQNIFKGVSLGIYATGATIFGLLKFWEK